MDKQLVQAAIQRVAAQHLGRPAQQIPHGAVLVPVPVQPPLAARIDQLVARQRLQDVQPARALAARRRPGSPEPIQLQALPQNERQPDDPHWRARRSRTTSQSSSGASRSAGNSATCLGHDPPHNTSTDRHHAVRCVAEAGAALVGADAIGTHSFVNKVGTLALAQAAHRAGTAFLVIAESFKWVPMADPPVLEPAFEAVPNALVGEFLADSLFRP